MRTRKIMALLCRITAILVLAGGAAHAAQNDPPMAGWPRLLVNADGSRTTIPARPKRILSTSVTITGTLLAIDAPLAASASSANGHFFSQWAAIADKRGVKKLWPAGSIDLEAAYAVAPDLIVVSASGGDSALAQLDELRQIAPTIVLDYGGQTWQQLATRLGQATGLEPQVADRLAAFDASLAEARSKIAIPAGLANIVSYNGPGTLNPIATGEGVHGSLLRALGFAVESPQRAWHGDGNPSNDFIRAQYENLTELRAQTTFLLSADDERAKAFLHDPILANLAAVKSGQVYGLGVNSFRIDYFSAGEIIDGIVTRFAKNHRPADGRI